jgi:hypothetical protein
MSHIMRLAGLMTLHVPICKLLEEIMDGARRFGMVERNPWNLRLHIQCAIQPVEQSGNASFKIVSSNQLRSGDVSIKAAKRH